MIISTVTFWGYFSGDIDVTRTGHESCKKVIFRGKSGNACQTNRQFVCLGTWVGKGEIFPNSYLEFVNHRSFGGGV